MMLKILVLGSTGMLGHMLMRQLSKRHELIGTARSGHSEILKLLPWFRGSIIVDAMDAMQPRSFLALIRDIRPHVVINAVGLVKQRQEAQDPVRSISVNALFPHLLGEYCELAGARLIHVSTDCVFSGMRGNYSEDDTPDPVDLYDRTKYLGEPKQERALTIRTSIVGREIERVTGLMEWFLSNRNQSVNGFTNAIFSGLTTKALSKVLERIITDFPNLDGIWHISSEPISKFELLSSLNQIAKLSIDVKPVAGKAVDKSLNSERFWTTFGAAKPGWGEMLNEFANDIPEYDEVRHDRKVYA